MNERNDFFQKKLSHTRTFTKRHRSYSNGVWMILAILLILAGGYSVYYLFYASPNLSGEVEQEQSLFSLGQEITLHGILRADGDILTHTHTLEDSTYGILAVKSKQINLGDYSDIVDVTGMVEKFYQGIPLIEITALSGKKIGVGEIMEPDIVLDKASGVYLLQAGVHFLPAFFEEYLLLNEGENGQILIQDLETNEEIAINYFRCNAANPDRNCKGLKDTFAQTAARSFVTANGDTYYKQSEVNSWFVANGDWWGIFINDVPEETVMKLKDLIVFANEKVMKNWIDFAASRICQNAEEKLQKLTSSAFSLKQEGLVATLKGQGITHIVECSIQVDFSLPTKGVLLSLTVGEGTIPAVNSGNTVVSEESKEPSTTTTASDSSGEVSVVTITPAVIWDPTVTQFPLNIEKGLTYTSSRGGYAVKFPSANISYAVSSVKENFGQANLSCSYVINVIKYSEKELLEISPAIRIYECEAKGEVMPLGEKYVMMQGADKVFIVQISDSAWIQFTNALSFNILD